MSATTLDLSEQALKPGKTEQEKDGSAIDDGAQDEQDEEDCLFMKVGEMDESPLERVGGAEQRRRRAPRRQIAASPPACR